MEGFNRFHCLEIKKLADGLVLLRKRTIGDGKYLRQKIQYFIRLTCAERKSPKNIKRTKGIASKSGNIGKRMSKLSRNICVKCSHSSRNICVKCSHSSRNICAKCSIVVGTFASNVPKRICVFYLPWVAFGANAPTMGRVWLWTLLLRGSRLTQTLLLQMQYSLGNIWRKCSYYARKALSERREGCFVTLQRVSEGTMMTIGKIFDDHRKEF